MINASATEAILETFTEQISAKGWQIRGDTPADGNCCFWAMSDQLDTYGQASTHTELRQLLVNHLHTFPNVSMIFYTFMLNHYKNTEIKLVQLKNAELFKVLT